MQMYLLKLLPLQLCKVLAMKSVVNTLRTGPELSALNIQEGKRMTSKLEAEKTFLGLRNTPSVSRACCFFGAAREGCTRKYPSFLFLRERKCISFFSGTFTLHVVGEPSAQFIFSYAQLQEAEEQLLHSQGAQAMGSHQCPS